MKNITLKLIAIILALSAIFTAVIVPVGAVSAENAEEIKLFHYTINDNGSLCISSINAPDEDVVIPSEIDGKLVTTFEGNIVAKTVRFPEKMTTIEGSIITEEITVDENNPNFCSLDGVLFNKEKTELVAYPMLSDVESYVLPEIVVCVGWYAFSFLGPNTKLKKLILEKNVKEFNSLDASFEEFEVHAENEIFCSIDGVLFSKDKETLVKYPSLKPDVSYNILDNTKEISYRAFTNCFYLERLSIPETVSVIGVYEEHSMEGYSFINNGFKDIEVSENNNYFRSVDGVLFTKDMKTLIAYCAGNERCSYAIPEGVETLSEHSFFGSIFLKSLGVPKSLNRVKSQAFSFDTRNYTDDKKVTGLVNIAYSGSAEEWANITVDENNEPFERANLVTNAKVEEETESNISVVYSKDNFNIDNESFADYAVRISELDKAPDSEISSGVYAGAKYHAIGYYDIEIIDKSNNDAPVQIGQGEVFITMPVPDELDINSDFVVYHVKDNGSRVKYSLNPNPEKGEKQLKIEFGHFVFSVDSFSVFEFYQVKEIEKISIDPDHAETSYLYNSNINNIAITVTYTDGTTETVTDASKMNITGFDNTKIGTQTVTVGYAGFTDDFEVEVYVKAENIAITKLPSKTSYTYKSGNLDLSGLVLSVTCTDGTTETVTDTSKMKITGFDSTKIGSQTVTVEYEGRTNNFEVTVSYAWWQMIIRILLLGFLWY